MESTTASKIFDSFESSFRDKNIIPQALELVWLKKAVARYSIELDPISFDETNLSFGTELDQYAIDTIAEFMKQLYQEREVSKINKRVSIVSKDLSVDGNNGSKTAAREELNYIDSKSSNMVQNQKPTAYA